MKTICVLTFGTSDVQINTEKQLPDGYVLNHDKKTLEVSKNGKQIVINLKQNREFKEWYLLSKCRKDGFIIFENFELLKPIIEMPLTIPLIENLHKNNKKIDKFILVYTDQKDITESNNFYLNDSLFIASIFKKIVKERFNYKEEDFQDYSVSEKVVDYDFQFIKMGEDCKKIIPYSHNEIEKIYLFPQGGIDQINTSLTLQLIKCFGFKVEIYQAKEKDTPKQIRFAELYFRDLTFDHILTLVNKGDYSGAMLLLKTLDGSRYKNLESLLKFGDLKINARFNEISNLGKKDFENEEVPEIVKEAKDKVPWCKQSIIKLFDPINKKQNDYVYRVSEYFEIARFFNKPESCNRFVMAFAIFIESFLNHFISAKTTYDLVSNKEKYKVASKKIIELTNNDEEIKNILKNNFKVTHDEITYPSVPVLLAMALKYSNNNLIIQLLCKTNGKYNDCICNLDDLRNDMAHRGIGIKNEDFDKISELFNEIQNLFTDKPCSFDKLNIEIKNTIDCYRNKLI